MFPSAFIALNLVMRKKRVFSAKERVLANLKPFCGKTCLNAGKGLF